MLYNHLFWLLVVLFFTSAINLNVYKEYKDSIILLPKIIGTLGLLGILVGFSKLIITSLEYNWWWFLNVSLVSLLSIGVFSFLFRKKASVVIGTINILFIPFIWWYGSKFNTVISSDWFYNTIEAISDFFLKK